MQEKKISINQIKDLFSLKIITKNKAECYKVLGIINSIYNLGIIGLDLYKNKKIQNEILPLYLKKPQAQRQLESKNINIRDMKLEDLNCLNLSEFDDFWNLEILRERTFF